MRILPEFMKNTLIGGVIFLLPLGIAIFLVNELLSVLTSVGDGLSDLFFPGSEAPFTSTVISIALLVTAAFFAGLIARTSIGDGASTKLQSLAKAHIPSYALMQQTVSEMTGGSEMIVGIEEPQIAKIDFGSFKRLGFVIEEISSEECVVYLPNSPSVFSGIVVIVSADQISDVNLKPIELIAAMRDLGHGLGDITRG